MKRMLSLTAMLAFAQVAHAACPVADHLIDTYGISFSGFKKALPEVARPLEHAARAVDLVVVRLPNRKGPVPDGFLHSALINKEAKRAWIRRKGGFAPEEKWYGPVKLDRVNLQGCVVDAYK
jgi:hypothetical protein